MSTSPKPPAAAPAAETAGGADSASAAGPAAEDPVDHARRRLLRLGAYVVPAVVGTVALLEGGCQAASCNPNACFPRGGPCGPVPCRPRPAPARPGGGGGAGGA